MLFNSWEFLIFFPVVTFLYFILPQKSRWFLLLIASCIFYMAFIPAYILILAATIVVDYFAGIYIENSVGIRRRTYLIASIVTNVGFLAFFKYFNFLGENITYLAQLIHWNYSVPVLMIVLPIGLSFHTFQAMSYTIEVYRGRQPAERHFGIYALYVMFYPQLVAGPIERPQNLIHQFREPHRFEFQRVADGLKLMTWGMFQKVVIADRLALLVNRVYDNPASYAGTPLIVATIFFAFQIYCDFSGYSSIAIGAAKVMGFTLMDNFKRPYFSRSIAEFWKRWHISLSSWFRDYFYISLGGNRVARWRWQFNLFATFLLSGLWHGANWTYVIWGALNGFYLIASLWTTRLREALIHYTRARSYPRLFDLIRVLFTFSLVCFAWIFFRARNVGEALFIVTNLFRDVSNTVIAGVIPSLSHQLGFNTHYYLIAIASIAILILAEAVLGDRRMEDVLSQRPAWLRWSIYYALITGILLFGVFNRSQFIYFQF